MKKIMNQKEFAEKIALYVRNALPEELAEADVRTASLNLWSDGTRMALLVIRPWNGTVTGFCLDGWYRKYSDGNAAAEAAAASIINDRRLYSLPSADSSTDTSGLEGGAVIYA